MISDDQIKDLVNKIIKEYEPEKILLFGSYAEGTANEDSDLDLFIVKDSSLSRHNRITDLKLRLKKYKFMYPIDLLIFTKKEIHNEDFGKFSFVNHVLKSGKVLYER